MELKEEVNCLKRNKDKIIQQNPLHLCPLALTHPAQQTQAQGLSKGLSVAPSRISFGDNDLHSTLFMYIDNHFIFHCQVSILMQVSYGFEN